jgi:hypothetical protein
MASAPQNRIAAVWRAFSRVGPAVLVAALAVCAVSDSSADEAIRNHPARIVRLRGRVAVLTPGARAWRPANEREPIHPGTRIATETGATVILELFRRNTVQLGEVTEISLDTAAVLAMPADRGVKALRTALRYQISQRRGRVLASLKGLREGSTFDLRTPIARVSARGTVFLSIVRATDGRFDDPAHAVVDFLVVEGAVNVSGPGLPEAVTVRKGEQIQLGDVPEGGGVTPIPPDRFDEISPEGTDQDIDALRLQDC